MISAVFRRGDVVAFVAEELKASSTRKAAAGWTGVTFRVRWQRSATSSSSMLRTDLDTGELTKTDWMVPGDRYDGNAPLGRNDPRAEATAEEPLYLPTDRRARICPRCASAASPHQGCWTCATCTYSRGLAQSLALVDICNRNSRLYSGVFYFGLFSTVL
jgi:hypothetical protein